MNDAEREAQRNHDMQNANAPKTPTLKDMVDRLIVQRGELQKGIDAIDRQLEEAGISTKPKRIRKTRSDAGATRAK